MPSFFVDLVLDGEAVGVPAEAAGDVVPGDGGVAGDDVLDGSGEEMAIMGKACSERGPVVKGEFWETFSELQARLEGIDFPPIGQNLLLLFREVESGGDVVSGERHLFRFIWWGERGSGSVS